MTENTSSTNVRPPARRGRWQLSRPTSFWILAVLLGLFLFAATAPSPAYPLYAAKFGFSATTVTAIYAVYAAGAVAALLTMGRLSDHLGRRRVLILALIVQIAGMVAFIVARDVAMLYVARLLQGAGTGIASGVISAWLLDLYPPQETRLGSLVGGIAPLAGLGTGALGSGALMEFAAYPLHLTFWILAALYAAGLIATLAIPDVVARAPGWLASMKPQVGIPSSARSAFAALAPSLIAIWSLGGLYASLGPVLASSLAATDSRIPGGLVMFALAGTGALASAIARDADPRRIVFLGSIVLVAGVAATLVAVVVGSAALLYAGSVVAGVGLGTGFSGVFRTVAPLAPPQKRNALVAAIYLVTYLSFSIPAIAAGFATDRFGLETTTYAYGVAVMVLALITTVAVSRRGATETAT